MVTKTIDIIFILLLTFSFNFDKFQSVTKLTKLSSELTSQTKTFSLSLIKRHRNKDLSQKPNIKHVTSNKKIRVKSTGEYATKIEVGNPPQEILVVIDTGSSLLHIASPKCFKTCKAKNIFDNTKSKTFNPAHRRKFHQGYATGKLKSYFASDTVIINNIKIKNQMFGYVEKQNKVLDNVGGILGLAYPRHNLPQANLFQNLINQKQLEKNIIGYYITPEGGSLQFGYIDNNLYKGPLNKHYVVEKNFRWTLKINDILINGKSLEVCGKRGCRGLIDTGTTDLLFPQKVYSKVSKHTNFLDEHNDIKNYPLITYVIDDIHYDLKPKDYTEITHKDGHKKIDLKINDFDLSRHDDIWIIGEPFLNRYYTVFDRDNDAIHIGLKENNR